MNELNELQTKIMQTVSVWCSSGHQTPITLDRIIESVEIGTASRNTVKTQMRSLQKKGYVRKAYRTRTTAYVKLRGI